jgi:hypothetical protein
MDAIKAEPISPNFGVREISKATCTSAAGSGKMSDSRMASAETSGTFTEGATPVDMLHDDTSNSAASDSTTNSPSVLYLEPGFSLVANSVVVVKCDYGLVKPQTYTYNFSIVNNTSDPIELNYQPIMRPLPFHQDHLQTTSPVIPGSIHASEAEGSLHIPIPRLSGDVSPKAKPVKIIKEEPVDYSITMNASSDTEMESSQQIGEFQESLEGSMVSLLLGLPLLYETQELEIP